MEFVQNKNAQCILVKIPMLPPQHTPPENAQYIYVKIQGYYYNKASGKRPRPPLPAVLLLLRGQ